MSAVVISLVAGVLALALVTGIVMFAVLVLASAKAVNAMHEARTRFADHAGFRRTS